MRVGKSSSQLLNTVNMLVSDVRMFIWENTLLARCVDTLDIGSYSFDACTIVCNSND